MPQIEQALQHHRAGRLQQAEGLYRQILSTAPNHADALHMLGVLSAQTGKHETAAELIERAIQINPNVSSYHNDLGEIFRAQGQVEAAIAAYQRALTHKPGDVAACCNLGRALQIQGNLTEAIAAYRQALALAPNAAEIYNNLGIALQGQGDLDDAVAAFEQARALNPNLAESHYNLGNARQAQGKLPAAIAAYRAATKLNPEFVEAHNNLGGVLRQHQRLTEAAEVLRTALRFKRDYPEAYNNLGLVLAALGDLEAAKECYDKAIELDPDYTPALESLAGSRRFGPEDKDEISRLQTLVDNPKLSASARISLHFALGKMLDDCGAYDQAFANYRTGNDLKRQTIEFDREQCVTNVSEPIAVFSRRFFESYHSAGHPSELPVFIVGMPRSGTTLVEQIIASHPQAFGADELPHIQAMALDLPNRLQTDIAYPRCVTLIDGSSAKSLAEDYLGKLAAIGGHALRITDKMPRNYLYLGFIALMFPRARIIHCRRDPLDVCLSIYFRQFTHGYNYAYDLGDIGFYYRQYQRLMQHWHEVLPLEICDMQYEELIANQESESRRLIDYCGLSWDDRCLEYHKNTRPVQTQSNWQVRRPIYTDSIQRWRYYERHLGELKQALAEGDNPAESKAAGLGRSMPQIEQALQHHRAGRLQQAEGLYRQILSTTPNHADALHMLGVLSAQTGKHETAVELIERAIQINPNVSSYHNDLGITWQTQGKLTEAIAAYRQALALEPNAAEIYNNLGIALQGQGDLDDAVAAFEQARALRPKLATTHYNLGNARQAQGKLPEAIAAYRAALKLNPDIAEAHSNLGIALEKQGALDDAVAALEKARALKPDMAEIHYNLGNARKAQGKLPEAIAAYRAALKLNPDFAEAHTNLGSLLKKQHKLGEAIACYKHALALKPDYAEAYNNLGVALRAHGDVAAAVATYKRGLVLEPSNADIHNNLGVALQEQNKLSEAIRAHQQALALDPDCADFHNNLGNALRGQGKLAAAISAYRQALAFEPEVAGMHSALISCLNYCADIEPADIFTEHRRWDRYAAPLAKTLQPHTNSPDPERRLRIGYVSPDFRRHSVAFFLEPLLAAHDRSAFEILCYANVSRPDSTTERFQGLADGWRNIVDLSDEQVAELVRVDAVDILIELAGHTVDNRLLVFARKPAPVQISYLGYPNTTGLATMDYRLTDPWADPPGQTESLHVEQLVRLSDCFLCYQPPPESPEVSPLPALVSGHVTFGSFNNTTKVCPETVAVWAEILRALPQARLIMKAAYLRDSGTRDHFAKLFKKNGVSIERIEFVSWIPSMSAHLELYNKVDIGLDPFPYNGTTTTCEALWMGVPVVSLAGHTHASRVGVSLLSNIGLPELIAQTPEAYVALALELANGHQRLSDLRAGLREKIKCSPLMDVSSFARTVESAYRTMWRRWCEKPRRTNLNVSVTGNDRTPKPISDQAEGLMVKVRGDIQMCVPNSVALLTPYVLLEQEDWFEDEIKFVRKLLKPGMHTIDIGASYGIYSLMMAKAVGPNGKVWSFEPTSGPAAFLKKSIKQNQYTNVVLRQIGLSNRAGTAKLKSSANSESNTLTMEGNGDDSFELVKLSTLDICRQENAWEIIDFVKMDAEGEERRIVEGGKQFFSEQSPLVLFEFKHVDALNVSLLETFRDIGYTTYRLVPGLGILIPFDASEELDPYQLNLFCCKPDRARILEEQGLLTESEFISSELPHAKAPLWRDFLDKLPYAKNLLNAWEESSRHLPGGDAYHEALDCYVQAHTEELSPAMRYACLQRCFILLSEIPEREQNICRLQSLARVSWEIGKRAISVAVLDALIARLDEQGTALREPFLAVSKRFEWIDPGGSIEQWCMAAALEQREKLCAYSSYFTGKRSLRALARMKDLPFYGAEMERRRQLIQLRDKLQHKPEFHPVLANQTEDNLNSVYWVGGDSRSPL